MVVLLMVARMIMTIRTMLKMIKFMTISRIMMTKTGRERLPVLISIFQGGRGLLTVSWLPH